MIIANQNVINIIQINYIINTKKYFMLKYKKQTLNLEI